MTNELLLMTTVEQSAALAKGEISSRDLTRAYLAEIEARDGLIGAYLTLNAEGALRAADASDKRRACGESLGPLDGIPYAAKDNFCTKGLRTTCGSQFLREFVPPYDATVIARLQAAGAILLGKLNMDEFAMGSSGELSALGKTKNPVDPAFVTGGSSSGSAAAVAANEASFALGSDTGGSVRQPAAFCGVLGLKPTYGVLSRYGLVAMASSLDCVGLVGKAAADLAPVLGTLVGKDPLDATSRTHPAPQFAPVAPLSPLRVAVVRELMTPEAVTPSVALACRRAVELLEAEGALVEEVSLPSPELALASYCVLSAVEAASNMARYDGVRFGTRVSNASVLQTLYEENRSVGFGEEVKRRILFGSHMLTRGKRELYYGAARAARNEIFEKMHALLCEYDLILNPTVPSGAFRRGDALSPSMERRADLCAVYASLAGLPAISIPFGRDENGMPLGIHFTAARYRERLLLEVARFFEEVRA